MKVVLQTKEQQKNTETGVTENKDGWKGMGRKGVGGHILYRMHKK